jgi:cation transport ATPase
MIKFKCPSCGVQLEADDSLSGKQATCAGCAKLVPVPLSKNDLKQKKAEEEAKALREENERAQAIYRRQEEETQEELDAKIRLEEERERAQERARHASWTENALWVVGGLCVAAGIIGALIIFVAGANEQNGWFVLWSMLSLASGFLSAMLYFAAALVLRYLRRIANAIEGRGGNQRAGTEK